jgi:hypothetical protein
LTVNVGIAVDEPYAAAETVVLEMLNVLPERLSPVPAA